MRNVSRGKSARHFTARFREEAEAKAARLPHGVTRTGTNRSAEFF